MSTEPTPDPRELEALMQALDDDAAEREAILREAAALPDAPGSDLVDETLRREWEGDAPEAKGPVRRWSFLVGLAAAAVMALFLWPGEEGPDAVRGPGETLLNTDERIRLLIPAQGEPLLDELRWTATSTDPRGDTDYLVRLRPQGVGQAPLLEEVVEGPSLSLEGRDRSTWPEQVVVEIEPRVPGSRRLSFRAVLSTR